MQRLPDGLVPLAVQHGLGHADDGDGWVVEAAELQRLLVIAAPTEPRTRAPVRAPVTPPPRRVTAKDRVRADAVRRDDRRSLFAQDMRAQREQVAAVRNALEVLYDAQGAYIDVLDQVRSSDTQVASAHQAVLAAHDALARVQGRGR